MPDSLHLEAARAAIQNRKHVLLEKPIATSVKDGKEICELAESSTRIFMVGHLLRFMAGHSIAKKSVDRGEIGDIVHVYARRNSRLAGARQYSSHRTDTHLHLMIHDIDYVNWITRSKVRSVFAKGRQILLKQYGMRDTILATLEYESGALAILEACWILPDNAPWELDDAMEIVGTKGALYIEGICRGLGIVSPTGIQRPDTVAWPEVNDVVAGSLYEELASFVDCIVKGTRPLVGAREALEALVVADAIDCAIRERREMTLRW